MKRRANIITVFGSSRPGSEDAHYREAQMLGAELASHGFVVCTGGYAGVMAAVAQGAKEAGGHTLGVTAAFFPSRANRWIDEEIRVESWQDRLFELVKRGHGYVACRGGTGTLAELAVVWEMLNKRVLDERPLVALGDFWRPLIEQVQTVEDAVPGPRTRNCNEFIRLAASPKDAAEFLAARF
jgi:uncharacterized protein (TIGR00730 family)